MNTADGPAPPTLRRGSIYRDVYARRIDERRVTTTGLLERGRILDGNLVFRSAERCAQALRDGIFELEIPSDVDLAAGDLFARQFHRGPDASPYGRFRDLRADAFGDPLLGFHERSNQIEQFLLERRFWATHYPPEIARLGESLTEISGIVLRSVLDAVGLPRDLRPRATGGCVDLAGSYHLTFNHYRPGVEGVGLASHKDDGFLTILRTTSQGLEVNRKGVWERVAPDPACFIINFGLTMEMLTCGCALPVSAIMHRVAHQTGDRSSFGHFTSSACEPGRAADIYGFTGGVLHRVCDARELIDANDHEIYEGTDNPGEVCP